MQSLNFVRARAHSYVSICVCVHLQDLMSIRRNTRVTANQIAVITPYRRQVQRIKTLLVAKGYASVQVGTRLYDFEAVSFMCCGC
jgi:hypothetical protein